MIVTGSGCQLAGGGDDFFHILRCCATAAPQNLGAAFCKLDGRFGKFLRPNIKNRDVVLQTGQAGIGGDNHWNGGVLPKLRQQLQHLLGPQGAVHTQRVDTQSLQHGDHGTGICTRHEFSLTVVDIGDKDRQIAALLGSQDGGLGLIGVIHGLN